MANSPSKRTHRVKPAEGLNLTPFIDMITCLMFFLMMFAAVIPVTIIDAPLPKIASTADEVKKAKDEDHKMEVTVLVSGNGFVLKSDFTREQNIPKNAQGAYNFAELHKALVGLKQRKPDAHEITMIPNDDISYEVMISVMDAARELEKGDNGFQVVPPEIAAKPESQQFNRLFPDVSIGGV